MKTVIAAVVFVASTTSYYEAKVTTFGCNSINEVHKLQQVRSDKKKLHIALLQAQFDGQCVLIKEGTVVEGSIDSKDTLILQLNKRSDPPGYKAPLSDFEIKARKHGSSDTLAN